MPDPTTINPLSNEDFRNDPYPFFRAALETQPVVRHDAYMSRPVSLFRFDDITEAVRDWTTYSSSRLIAEEHQDFRMEKVFGNFLTLDPPRHTVLRRLAQPGFLPRVINSFRPTAERLATERLDAVLGSGEVDLVEDFAAPIAIGMIATVLGLPQDDTPLIRRWTAELSDHDMADLFLTEPEPARAEVIARVTAEMCDYFADHIAERRRKPREGDIISRILDSEVDGIRYNDDEVESTAILFLLAGQDSTTSLVSNYVALMAQHPDQADLVRADLDRVNASIEETLRYAPSFLAIERRATCDITIHGIDIEEDDNILLWIAAANRDPRVFDQPDRFDIGRKANRHLGFGHGIHFCIGAPLARMEGNTVARLVMERTSRLEITGDAVRPGSTNLNGPMSQPAVLTPA